MTPEELLKEVGEPTCWMTPDGEGWRMRTKPPEINTKLGWIEFYTSDQVAAAVLKATKPLEEEIERYKPSPTVETCRQMIESQAVKENKILFDQLAKAEQRVAEACALQVATEIKFHWLDAARVAKEIRSGEWRKFVKEV